ncbi:hypothetical protein [Sulfitobacter sp. R18_1]|uniref:hypothetical protein n=1 Tax=Sulfitobacter sp. R18_1 TaxID=2821104 RepID=UPI001ADCB536|nr:hypothetical protein [Sulfitobacter sp. R18_1]MBO9428082.1 hypothetical protein [Sulfitobacter sp. R18_1]
MTTVSNHISDIDLSKTVPLRKDQVVTHKGIVDATLIQRTSDPKHLFDWHRLASWDELDVPAGHALIFKIEGGWKRAEFFDDGRLKGPLTFAIDEIRSPKKSYASIKVDRKLPTDLIILFMIIVGILVSFSIVDQRAIVTFFVEVFVLIALVLGLLSFMIASIKDRIPVWRGDDACLKKLKDLYKGPQMV